MSDNRCNVFIYQMFNVHRYYYQSTLKSQLALLLSEAPIEKAYF